MTNKSTPNFEEQIEVVNNTLQELKVNEKPMILVFNKIDQLKEPLNIEDDEDELPYIDKLKRTWIAKSEYPVVFISASRKINIDELRTTIKFSVLAMERKLDAV